MALRMKPWVKVHNAIDATATSDTIDCTGFNGLAVMARFSAAQNWTFSIKGGMGKDAGTFAACYDNGGTAMSKQTNADIFFVFHNVPDYVQVTATEDVNGATVTVWVAPCQV